MRGTVFQSHHFQEPYRTLTGLLPLPTPDKSWQHYIFQGAKIREQIVKLENKTNLLIAEVRNLLITQFRKVSSSKNNTTASGMVQSPQDMKQGTLTHPGISHDRHSLPLPQL